MRPNGSLTRRSMMIPALMPSLRLAAAGCADGAVARRALALALVLDGKSRLEAVRSREIIPCDRNRHVQASSPEQALKRTPPRRSKSQASQRVGQLV